MRQAGIRHASKSARGSKSVKSSNKTSKVDRASSKASTSGTNNKSSSSSSIDSSSSQTANSASKSAAQDSINEVYVKEKVIFETGPNEKVADARVLLGFGFMFCVFVRRSSSSYLSYQTDTDLLNPSK